MQSKTEEITLPKEEQWMEKIDLIAFKNDIKELGSTLEKQQGQEDVDHLHKMMNWSNACAFVGIFSMGFGLNLISVLALSTWTLTRWVMIGHHVCHGGYDKCHPDKRFNRFFFAVGSMWRRFIDWLDWMLPEAWNVEHNNRHHYFLSEIDDPDLVEENLSVLRASSAPLVVKYLVVFINMLTWKWQYYAPNTYKEYKLSKLRKEGKAVPEGVEAAYTVKSMILGEEPRLFSAWEFLRVVIGPFLMFHFVILPLPYYFLGQYLNVGSTMYFNAVSNLLVAELLTNIHSFIIVVTNHAGDDMYRFNSRCRPFSGSFYLRQVLASVNFRTGSDINDFLHGYLNYQIEHHLWPNLSMRSYQKAAPLVKDICKKHGVPYVQENVFWRVWKTSQIMVGSKSMKRFPGFYEGKFLEIDQQAKGLVKY
jgi:fatty acid desaturase